MSLTLDIGCGNAKTAGAIGIDANPDTQADIIYDLDQYPWPVADSTFERVVCSHVVEHVSDMIRFMEEVHRLCMPRARIDIITPHFTNRFAFTDPTHRRHLTIRSFDYFLPPSEPLRPSFIERAFETAYTVPTFYTHSHFKIVEARMRLARPFRLLGLQWFANRFPNFYELYLAFVFPARDLYFTLEAVK
jgi:SAM-dependent methyltransferase